MPDVWFPHLGISFEHLNSVAFSIMGYEVAWYGILIAFGFLMGLIVIMTVAHKSLQNTDLYVDFFILGLIFGIIGARLYFVLFSWTDYKDHPMDIFKIHQGGLAIYGGIITVMIVGVIFCLIKKIKFTDLLDTCLPATALGQAIGRWGNFFNQEAFGSYTDNLFAMRLNVRTASIDRSSELFKELLDQAVTVENTTYIQVHPTFLYESVACLIIFVVCLLLWRHRKFSGRIASFYLVGYGITRFFIEQLRTDPLTIDHISESFQNLTLFGQPIRISVLVSAAAVLGGLTLYILKLIPYIKSRRSGKPVEATDLRSCKHLKER